MIVRPFTTLSKAVCGWSRRRRVTILTHRGLVAEGAGIAFGAALLRIHAGRLAVELAAGTMDHSRPDDGGQLPVGVPRPLRELGAYHLVDDLRFEEVLGVLQKQQHVHVGESPLLILNGPHAGGALTEDPIPKYLGRELLLLELEHPGDDVGAIDGLLTPQQLSGDLRPVVISGQFGLVVMVSSRFGFLKRPVTAMASMSAARMARSLTHGPLAAGVRDGRTTRRPTTSAPLPVSSDRPSSNP